MATPSGITLDLLHALAERLGEDGPVEIGTMFRSPGLRTGTKILAFIGHGDRLIIKLPHARANALIVGDRAEPVTMGTRTMREWVAIRADTDYDVTLANWTALAREAFHYVRQQSR
jgi:hypothetical protein